MVLLQGLCYVVDITMVFLTFIGIFDFVFHLVELSRVDERGLLLPYRTVPGIYCWRFHVAGFMLFYLRIIFKAIYLLHYSGCPCSMSLTLPLRGTREPLLNRVLIIIISNIAGLLSFTFVEQVTHWGSKRIETSLFTNGVERWPTRYVLLLESSLYEPFYSYPVHR